MLSAPLGDQSVPPSQAMNQAVTEHEAIQSELSRIAVDIASRLSPNASEVGLIELSARAKAIAETEFDHPLHVATRDLIAGLLGDCEITNPRASMLIQNGLNIHGHGCRELLPNIQFAFGLSDKDMVSLLSLTRNTVTFRMFKDCNSLMDVIRIKQHNGSLYPNVPAGC